MSNKMNLTILASSIGILQVFLGFTTANVLLINRNSSGKPWINRDSFTIPSSLCQQNNGHDECEPFRALNDKHQNCSCYCPSQNSSFVYHSNKWTCLQNGRVRDLQDCRSTVFFLPEPNNPPQPLWTIDIGGEWYTNISFGEEAGSSWEHCEVHLNSSWYLGCDGSRFTSSQYLNKTKEVFALRGESTDGRPPQFVLLVNRNVRDAQMLKGKIINLGIQCSTSPGEQPQYHGCLMFKLSGQQTCNVSVPNLQKSTTLKPTKPTFKGKPTPVTVSFSTSSSQRASTSLFSGSIALVTQTTMVVESTATSLPPNVRPRPSSGRERSTDEGSSSVGLIAGLTVATVALAVFIVGFLVYRRCHSKKKNSCSSANGNTTQDTVIMSPQTNSAVQSDGQNGSEFSV